MKTRIISRILGFDYGKLKALSLEIITDSGYSFDITIKDYDLLSDVFAHVYDHLPSTTRYVLEKRYFINYCFAHKFNIFPILCSYQDKRIFFISGKEIQIVSSAKKKAYLSHMCILSEWLKYESKNNDFSIAHIELPYKLERSQFAYMLTSEGISTYYLDSEHVLLFDNPLDDFVNSISTLSIKTLVLNNVNLLPSYIRGNLLSSIKYYCESLILLSEHSIENDLPVTQQEHVKSYLMEKNMETVSMLEARDVVAECPHCHEKVGGFLIDPRGHEVDCEFCEKKFKIHQ